MATADMHCGINRVPAVLCCAAVHLQVVSLCLLVWVSAPVRAMTCTVR
jgi:hypothetical protein